MSPQAGDENGERGSQAPPWSLVCHSVSGACTVCCAGILILLGSRFWGIWHPWADRGCRHGSAVAQPRLGGAMSARAGSCRWVRRWAAPRKFVHAGERVTVAAAGSGLPRERVRPQHTGPAHLCTW